MAVSWTDEQQQVIDTRNSNILVSAAAGSGKTAVLVERILSMVTDPEHPIDIDTLLVVTFTRAAAAEMKERIRMALEEALAANPEDEHLQKQSALIHNAQITTIHGFCGYVIQNYFHMIDLNPVYRIGDEGELNLLKQDVLETILEDAYTEARPDFLDFVECYAPGKTDKRIGEMILKLYEFAMSYPFPEEWLAECQQTYEVETEEELQKLPWMKEVVTEIHLQLQDALEMTNLNIKEAKKPGGPYLYLPMLESDATMLEELQQADAYEELYDAFEHVTFQPLSRKKDESIDPERKEESQSLRKKVKAKIEDIQKKYCARKTGEILEELCFCQSFIAVLIRLTQQFMEAYGQAKQKKNLADFSDLEHYALQILVKKEDGVCHYTDAAKELSKRFSEVMIDEYQDSNYIQEFLLEAVSKVPYGGYNRFMVGDVKQSIYSFRLARPELFLEKQETYNGGNDHERRIDLHKNFRSRGSVLHTVNEIFYQIMAEDLGGIEYDETEALYLGADYPEGCDEAFTETEVMLIDSKDSGFEDANTREGLISAEALAVAQRIRDMVGKEQVWDKGEKAYRPMEYRDCVILLRTVNQWADIFCKVLHSQGIPAYTTSKTGYFSALEVTTVMNYLRICDNPKQEIPYAAVLHSPIGNCSAEELALIKSEFPEDKIYEACTRYTQEGKNKRLGLKLANFLRGLQSFRQRVSYTPIHDLLTQVLTETGYGAYVAAMPAGEQREANLHMLVEKAIDFEATSYRGLFNFIRYMEQIQKYEMDFGEVNIHGEAANTVRIMSIHKSKGLEFPVVYVAGMGKQFNFTDANSGILLHSQLGIGADVIDSQLRTKNPSLLKIMIRQRMIKEMLGEELRVLYVAMTRAKEKLILCGYGNVEKWDKNSGSCLYNEKHQFSYGQRAGAKSYMDWVYPALVYMEIPICVVSPEKLVTTEIFSQMDRAVKKAELLSWDCEKVCDAETKAALQERFTYEYPYQNLSNIPVKLTVSELKKMGDEEPGEELFFEPDVVPLIPKFMKEEEEHLGGAARGTVYHKVLECLDYAGIEDSLKQLETELQIQIQKMVEAGKLSEADTTCIRIFDLVKFLQSPVGRQMREAFLRRQLWREQPFVLGIPASDVNRDWPAEETILVQGIIDAYYQEGEHLVIVDYKTDRVDSGGAQELVDKYQKQLWYYKKALEQLTGKEVARLIIYSVSLGKEICIEV